MITTDNRKTLESFGTGFIVEKTGVAITPQHVYKPWLFDESLQAMIEIGLVRLLPESVRHTIWTAGEQVVVKNTSPAEYLMETAFTENTETQAIQFLYAPEPHTVTRQVDSPFGTVEIQSPVPGPSDVVVLQLIDFDRVFSTIEIETKLNSIEALDEVLLIGYPLSRLSDGKSVPQAVRGFVRRPATEDMLELHSAVHPGTSGAPVMNSLGHVIGMAVAMFGSDSYGAAIPSSILSSSVAASELATNDLKLQLSSTGCAVGPMDGKLDLATWNALRSPSCQEKETVDQPTSH